MSSFFGFLPIGNAVGDLLDAGGVEVVQLQQGLSPLSYVYRRTVRFLETKQIYLKFEDYENYFH